MIEFRLLDGENAYEAVGEYVRSYWEHETCEDTVVSMETSYDGIKWVHIVEVVEPEYCSEPIWLNDWWEGEKYIQLLGICGVSDLDIYGGLYEDDFRD